MGHGETEIENFLLRLFKKNQLSNATVMVMSGTQEIRQNKHLAGLGETLAGKQRVPRQGLGGALGSSSSWLC